MLGNPGNTKPEFCMNVAGPWTLDFEIIECRNAISSTQDARCGTRLLTHLPHAPCCFHSQGLFMMGPGSLWKSSTLPPGRTFRRSFESPAACSRTYPLAGSTRHEELHDALGFGAMVQAAIQLWPRFQIKCVR